MKNKKGIISTLLMAVLLLSIVSGTTAGALTVNVTEQIEVVKEWLDGEDNVNKADTTIIYVPCVLTLPPPPPPPEPDVGIIKKVWNGTSWADSATFEVGDDIQFRITVKNTGNINLDNYVHVDDDLPSFLTYNYDANLTPTSASDHHVEWHDLAPLIYNESIEITFSAHADSIGESDNAVAVEAQYDCMTPVDDCDIVHIVVESGCEDNEPPETIKEYGKPFYTDGIDDWITSDTLIWLNATDNDSGVANTFYRISKWNGVSWEIEIDWTVYTGPFSIPSQCKHKIEFYSVDNACNEEEIKWQTVFVDNTPPCVWYKVTDDPDHYVCRVSTLTIEAQDAGPCAVGDYWIYVYVDGEFYEKAHNKKISFQFNKYFGFDHQGRYIIEFWAVDILGNEGEHQIESFFIDDIPPDTDYSFLGPNRWVEYHWQIEPTTKIILNATDSGVGVDYTLVREGWSGEGGNWTTYSGPFVPGNENIFYASYDLLRNTEGLHHLYVEIVESIENNPPEVPEIPSGGNTGYVDYSYTYSAETTDPEGNQIKYYFNWGDGTDEWTDFKDSGVTVAKSHAWNTSGTYKVKVKAQDEYGAESVWSDELTVYITSDNLAPHKPNVPTGPASCKAGLEYNYMVKATDPDNDPIYYLVDFGDGTVTGWLGPYKSGKSVDVPHTWQTRGSYTINVRAKDVFHDMSEWSEPLTVSVSKARVIQNPIVYRILFFFEQLFERFLKI